PPIERARYFRIKTSMPIRTAARNTSAPPSQSPHCEKRRTSPISFSMRISAGPLRGAIPLRGERCTTSALRGRRFEHEHLADGLVPLLGAFRAATLGPTREHHPLDELLMGLRLLGLDRHNCRFGEPAHGAGLLPGVAVVRLGRDGLDRRPHLV